MNRAKEESAKKHGGRIKVWPLDLASLISFTLQNHFLAFSSFIVSLNTQTTVVVSGFPRQCSLCLVSDALVFTLAEVVLSIQFRGPDVGGCVYHRSCRQTGLELKKIKLY